MIPVIFVAPRLTDNAARMVDAVGALPGVRLGVITGDWLEDVVPETRARIAQHWHLDEVLDVGALRHAVQEVAAKIGGVVRLIGAWEQLQVPLAAVRESLGIPGLPIEAAVNFRDKARMKDRLRAAGVPCARHALVRRWIDAIEFAERVGFPLVVKPQAGAGAQATWRVDNAEALSQAIDLLKPTDGAPVVVEEFVVGTEHSLETISLHGRPVWHSLTHYRPTPLEVLRNPWIQWVVVLPREVDHPRYDEIKAIGDAALKALGQTTGLTHMEWFQRADGSLAVSEIAARPPGAQITTMISRANDIDFIADWARVMVFGEFEPPVRKYAVAAAYLRGQGSGVIRRVRGLDAVNAEVGHLICDMRLPVVGQSPAATYEGDGYIIVRHPETAVVERAIRRVVELVQVELG